jgi:hypothetical protein
MMGGCWKKRIDAPALRGDFGLIQQTSGGKRQKILPNLSCIVLAEAAKK